MGLRLQTVHAFLARAPSKGPHERPDGEFTGYDEADLDIRVLLALARTNSSLAHVACIPDFSACLDDAHVSFGLARSSCTGKGIRAGVVASGLLTRDAKLWLPPDLTTQLYQCRRKRFVVCNFGLYATSDFDSGHANALIFDTKHRIIERYEPTGRSRDVVDASLERLFGRALPDWTYIGTALAAPARGAQRRATDRFRGLCVTFSLLYVLMRLLNPETPAETLNHYLGSMDGDRMRDTVLRLNRYAANLLRRYERGSLARD